MIECKMTNQTVLEDFFFVGSFELQKSVASGGTLAMIYVLCGL